MDVSAIAAVAANGVIGFNNKIPWEGQLNGDLALFKENTLGKAVIMGRNTWESLPSQVQPLPDRLNILLTSSHNNYGPGTYVARSVEEALAISRATGLDAVFIGGERVYREGLPHCNTLYISRIQDDFLGDTFFPEMDTHKWKLTQTTLYPAEDKRTIAFRYEVLKRIL